MLGNAFIAPAGWTISVRGPATILEPPEGDSLIVLFDVRAKDGEAALAAAWAAYKPDMTWPLKVANGAPDKDGSLASIVTLLVERPALRAIKARFAPRKSAAPASPPPGFVPFGS